METATIRLSLLALVLMIFSTGCSTWHETTKETKRLYKDYILPLPSVDLDTDNLDGDTLRLARAFKPVDVPVTELRRFLDGTNSLPRKEWFKELFTRFPWLSGVMLVDTFGSVQFRHPEESLKQHDPAPFLEFGEEWNDYEVRAFSVNTPLGPEVYLASPTFKDNEWTGLIIVHFDPRRLLEFCPEPEELIIVSPGEVLWAGKHEFAAEQLSQMDWKNIYSDREFGYVDAPGGKFAWIAKHVGSFYLIYAALAEPVEGSSGSRWFFF